MIPKRSSRAIAAIFALTVVSALFASPVLARPPSFGGSALPSPGTVSPSTADDVNYVRFDVTFTNTSNSNIQQLTMTAATPLGSDLEAVVVDPFLVDPSGTTVGPFGACDDTGLNLSCSFGALNALYSVKLSVVYEIPITTATTMDVTFIFKSTGAAGTDPKRSHGDDFPLKGTVNIDSSDFGGSYLFDPNDLDVGTDPVLTKRGNPQSTLVHGPEANIPVTASEVPAGDFDCPADVAASCFGQWSVINVNNGQFYLLDGFTIVIGYDQVSGSAGDVQFVHLVGSSLTPRYITESCDADTPINCIDSVDTVMGDTFYTLILGNNGPLRGF